LYVPVSDFSTGFSSQELERFRESVGESGPESHLITFRSHFEELGEIMVSHVFSQCEKRGLTPDVLGEAGLLLGCHGTVLYPLPGITDTGYADTIALFRVLEDSLSSHFRSVAIGWLNHGLGGEWTSPTLEESARRMLDQGLTRFVYFPFGFLADNAESELEGRTIMERVGIGDYHHLPCLNDNREFLHFLAKLVIRCMGNAARKEPASSFPAGP